EPRSNRWRVTFGLALTAFIASAFLVFTYLARPSKRISAMNDQELGMHALRKAGLIIAEHQEPGLHDAKGTIASLIEVLDRWDLAAVMDLEWDYRLWFVKWFPMLFDLLTVLLLAAGCMLFWLNQIGRAHV